MAGKWFYRRAWADQVETGGATAPNVASISARAPLPSALPATWC